MRFRGLRPARPGFEIVSGFAVECLEREFEDGSWAAEEAWKVVSLSTPEQVLETSSPPVDYVALAPAAAQSEYVSFDPPRPRGKLALELAALYSQPDRSLADFANKWGPLRGGLDIQVAGIKRADSAHRWGTRLSVWRSDIWDLVVVLTLARWLKLQEAAQRAVLEGKIEPETKVPLIEGEPVDLSKFFDYHDVHGGTEVLFKTTLPHSSRWRWVKLVNTAEGLRPELREYAEDADFVTLGWAYIAIKTNEMLAGVTAMTFVPKETGSGLAMDVQCVDLLSWIWFDLAESLTKEGGLGTCLYCGKLKPWKVKSTTKAAERKRPRNVVRYNRMYCSDPCRMKGQRAIARLKKLAKAE